MSRSPRRPLILGLTGSIAMGKSTAAAMFRAEGVPVHDADAAVHALYAKGGAAVRPVAAAFGADVVANGAIDRARLSPKVAGNPAALARLEAIVHPLLAAGRRRFLARARRTGARLAVFDVPLLYEVGLDKHCDRVAVVTAPAFLQRQRALARPEMSADKLAAILIRQMPDAQKRRRADVVLPMGDGKAAARRRIKRLVRRLRAR